MNRKIKYLGFWAIMFSFGACENAGSTAELPKANWLLGDWENQTKEGLMIETWEQQNDSTFFGYSYFLIGKDTVSTEKISLVQEGEELFYIPTVGNQNEGKPIRFKKTLATAQQLVFENPAHDFPQKITYTQINKDSLVAEISGLMEGQQRSQAFPMGRKK